MNLSIFRLKYDYTDAFEELRARGLWRIAWALLFVSLAVAVYMLVLNGANSVLIAGLIGIGAVLSAVTLALLNRGYSLSASLLFILELFVVVSLSYALTHAETLVLTAFSIPIVAAGVLLNRRGMLVMIGLTIAALAVTGMLNELGALPPALPPRPTLTVLIAGSIIIGVDGLILVVFAGGQRTLLRFNTRLNRELRSSTAISQSIAAVQAMDDLLNQTVNLIRDHLEYYHVHIYLLEEQSKLLVLRAGTSFTTDQLPSQGRRITPDDPGIINRAVQTRTTQMVTASDAALRRIEMLPGMQSQLVLLLRRGDQVLGVLDIQDIDGNPFREEDVEVLQAIASQLSIAVENARRFGDLQKASDDRQRLADELRLASQEIEQLNQEVTERVWTRYLAGRGETVIGYDWKQGTLTPAAETTPGLDRAITSRQPELYVDGEEHVLSVPIISRGQVLGAMEFRAPANRLWNKRSLELARVISQRLALALDNVRLFEQAQIIATREQLANQIAANLQSKTDIDTLVNVAAESFQQALGAIRANIRLGFPEQQPASNGHNGSH